MTGPEPRPQTNWDGRVAGNFIGGGTGTGLLMLGGLAAQFSGTPMMAFVIPAQVLIIAGLLLVWHEIGRPWRFLHVVFNVRTSWMTREAIMAPPLLVVAGQAIIFDAPLFCIIPTLFAFAFLFCQSRMLTAAKGIPAWREPMAGPLIIITGLTEGAGLLLVIVLITSGDVQWLVTLLLVLVSFSLAVWSVYRRRLAAGGAPTETLKSVAGIGRWLVPLGFALPIVAGITSLVLGPPAWLAAALAGFGAIAGGWVLKFRLVTEAACTQGFALPLSPVRGQGSAGAGARPGWD